MLLSTTESSMTTYAANGHLQPKDEMWEPSLPIAKQTFNWNGTQWVGSNIVEGNTSFVKDVYAGTETEAVDFSQVKAKAMEYGKAEVFVQQRAIKQKVGRTSAGHRRKQDSRKRPSTPPRSTSTPS